MKGWLKLVGLLFVSQVLVGRIVDAVSAAVQRVNDWRWQPLEPGDRATVWPGGLVTVKRAAGD